jgi:hypothetical protein
MPFAPAVDPSEKSENDMTDKFEHSEITAFVPDEVNANKGTERGNIMLEKSLEQYGAGRSILTDKHGNVIAGNKTLESAVGIGLKKAVVVHTTGDELVVVQRDDLDLKEDARAMELGVADNRVSETNLTWAVDMLGKLEDKGARLDLFFTPKETEDLLEKALAFSPNTNPITATGAVTDDQINTAGDQLGSRFQGTGTKENLVETACPECGHEFTVRPYQP